LSVESEGTSGLEEPPCSSEAVVSCGSGFLEESAAVRKVAVVS